MQFTRQIQYLHSRLAPDSPIETFVDAVRAKAIGLSDKSQFYAPVRFSVQICGEISAPAGAIRVDVPVHANPNWLADMKKRFAGMIGLKNALSNVDISFKTINGKNIADLPVDDLYRVGKLNVYVGDKKIRLPNMPEIPVEYSVCKEANIQKWVNQLASELPEVIAQELCKYKTEAEIDRAVRGDGSVVRLISAKAQALAAQQFTEWSDFLRVHHMNSPDSISPQDAQQTLARVSSEMLGNVRRFIEASHKPITAYLQSVEAKQLALEINQSEHYKPLFGKAVAHSNDMPINAFDMYHKIAEDALASPLVHQNVVATIYNRPIDAGCRWETDPDTNELRKVLEKGGKRTVGVVEKARQAENEAEAAKRKRERAQEELQKDKANKQKQAELKRLQEEEARAKEEAKRLVREAAARLKEQQDEALRKANAQKEDEEFNRRNMTAEQRYDAILKNKPVNFANIPDGVVARGLVDSRFKSLSKDELASYIMNQKYRNTAILDLESNDAVNYIANSFGVTTTTSGWFTTSERERQEVADEIVEKVEQYEAEKQANEAGGAAASFEPESNTPAPQQPAPKAPVPKQAPVVDEEDTSSKQAAETTAQEKPKYDLNLSKDRPVKDINNDVKQHADQLTKSQWVAYADRVDVPFTPLTEGVVQAAAKKFGIPIPTNADGDAKKRKQIMSDALIAEMIKNYGLELQPSNAQISAHHPWNAQIHHTLQPMADGAYPAYYNLLHTKQDMSKNAEYKGDLAETYKAYHMFAGLPISPPGLLIEKRAHSRSRKGAAAHSKDGDEKDEKHSFYMKSEMPPLVPLRRQMLQPVECGSCGNHSDSDDDEKDKKIKSRIGSSMQPVACGSCNSDSDEEFWTKPTKSEIPQRPPLIRLDKVQAKIRARMVPISDEMPIEDEYANEEIGETFGLPTCSDVFGD